MSDCKDCNSDIEVQGEEALQIPPCLGLIGTVRNVVTY